MSIGIRNPATRAVLTLVAASGLAACVEQVGVVGLVDGVDGSAVGVPDSVAPPSDAACLSPSIAVWAGTATREQGGYPDDVAVSVTWQRVATTGCVDRYTPSGQAHYEHAIPGALCSQSVAPADRPVAATDGVLEVDRTTSPPTFVAHGATRWTATWTCVVSSEETNTHDVQAGGRWIEIAGMVDGGRIEGSDDVDAPGACGDENATLPCTYTWSFVPVAP